MFTRVAIFLLSGITAFCAIGCNAQKEISKKITYPEMCLSLDWEKWNRAELDAAARNKDPDAYVKLAELKERSSGGKYVDFYLEQALKINPNHMRANLFYGIRLSCWQLQGWGKSKPNPTPYLEKVLALAGADTQEYSCAMNAIIILQQHEINVPNKSR